MSSVMRSDARRGFILVVSCGWTRAGQWNSGGHGGAACFTHGETLDNVENRGDEEDAECAGCQHSADNGSAHDLTRDGACAAGGPERDAAEDESEGSHQDG